MFRGSRDDEMEDAQRRLTSIWLKEKCSNRCKDKGSARPTCLFNCRERDEMDDEESVGTPENYVYEANRFVYDEDEEADFEDCVENCREERGLSRRSCKRRCNSRGGW